MRERNRWDMRTTLKRAALFAGVFLLTLYCFFLYDDEIIASMLVVEVFYALLSAPVLLWMKKKLHISMAQILPIAEKNQNIYVRIQTSNLSRIPVIHYQVQVRTENLFTGEICRYRMEGSVSGRKTDQLEVIFQSNHCGNIQITLEQCILYDWLFLFRTTIRLKETQNVGILPECHLLPIEVTRKTREFLADAEEYSERESGDDPSEIYQVREYREKDSIHDIHWKLSAKADELLVKEHGRPLGCAVLIWLNLETDDSLKKYRQKERKKELTPERERLTILLETAASLSFSLLEERCVHMVAWYEPQNQCVQKKQVRKEEHVYELLNRLLYVQPYARGTFAEEQYEEAFRGVSFSTVVEFRMDASVWTNQVERMRLPEKAEQIRWEELYFTV